MKTRKEKKAIIRARNKKHNLVNLAEEEHQAETARRYAEQAEALRAPERPDLPPIPAPEDDRDLPVNDQIDRLKVRLGRKRSRARALWHERIAAGSGGGARAR